MPDATVTAIRKDLLTRHNNLRIQRNGKTMLVVDSGLQSRAQAWADYMARTRDYRHMQYADPSGWNTFINYCYKFKHIMSDNRYHWSGGENIAVGQTTTFQVMHDWRYSCKHYYAMVDGTNTHVGFGVSRASNGVLYWCTRFGGYDGQLENRACPSEHTFNSSDAWRCPGGGRCAPY
jgi:uncharacterized protein YkwD